jgi:hypothetical protein
MSETKSGTSPAAAPDIAFAHPGYLLNADVLLLFWTRLGDRKSKR